jgi:hypothetical protein
MYETYYQSFVNRDFEPIGLPQNYPVPVGENVAFYIQRNMDENAIVYELNLNTNQQLNLDEPLVMHWVRFCDGNQIISDLNQIQIRLAYGYKSQFINNDLIQFQFVCHPKKFYIRRNSKGVFEVVTFFAEEKYHILKNIFVYAEEFGAFPDVKFVEFFGTDIEMDCPSYFKMEVNI